VAGVLYVKGKAKVSESQVASPALERSAGGDEPSFAEHAPAPAVDHGMVAGLDDGGQGSAAAPNEALAPAKETEQPAQPSAPTKDKIKKPNKPRPGKAGESKGRAGGGDGFLDAPDKGVAVGQGRIVTESGGDKTATPPAIEPSVPAPSPGLGNTSTAPASTPSRDELLIAGENVETTEATTDDDVKKAGGKAPQRSNDPDDGKAKLDQLTRQARTAAKSGDCGVVKSIGGRVKKANAAYYKQTFAADAGIKKCL
jgi:hypothetical protein